MITTGDIEYILVEDLKSFGVEIFKKSAIHEDKVTKERIVIIPSELKDGTYWGKVFVEVNFCVPDLKKGIANKTRLTELEREAKLKLWEDIVSVYDDTWYKYSGYSIGQEQDIDLECHYVNVKLLFEILNC